MTPFTQTPSLSKTALGLLFGLLISMALSGCGGGSSSPTPQAASAGAGSGTPDISTALAYIKSSSGHGGGLFGYTVALSADGTTLAVGAPEDASNATGIDGDPTDTSAINAGAVYVFTRSGGAWVRQAYLKGRHTEQSDEFGFRIALSASGDTLAVGAIGEDSKATGINGDQTDNTKGGAGAVYVFQRSAGSWAQQAYVKAGNADSDDLFGYSVALSGDGHTLAVGAMLEDGLATDPAYNANDDSGAVYTFSRNPGTGTWTPHMYLKASNGDIGDQFGMSMALSSDGETLVVGANREQGNGTAAGDNSLLEAGAAYVFTRPPGGAWAETFYLKASNPEDNDEFGEFLALSGDGKTLAVAAEGEDSNGPDQSNNSASGAGAVYVFARNAGNGWVQTQYLKASNAGSFDRFGRQLALSGDGGLLVVGARGESSRATGINGDQTDDSVREAGAAYAFVRDSGGGWTPLAYIKATNPGVDDQFGAGVALSGDGRTLAVGAPGESSNATGINGDQTNDAAPLSGAVYVLSITTN